MDLNTILPYAPILVPLVGGLWAYLRFVRERARYPRVTLKAAIEQIGWFGGERLLRISVEVKNEGTVRLIIPKMRYTLRTLHEGDLLEGGDDNILGQPHFPHVEVHRRAFTHPRHHYAFVDAGTTTTFISVAQVPSIACIALAQITLRYRDPRSDFHGALAVLELPARPIPESRKPRRRKLAPDDPTSP
jgi:hypothetical protein